LTEVAKIMLHPQVYSCCTYAHGHHTHKYWNP